MVRVLNIANARMGSGGVESFLMNVYRNIDRNRVQMDFVVFSDEVGCYEEEIHKMGGKIYKVTRKKDGIVKNLNQIRKIVKDNNYKIVHRHCASAIMVLDIWAARLGGAKRIIAHSHSIQTEHSGIHKVCKFFLNHSVNTRFACGIDAGKWMYGKKSFRVVRNGICCDEYIYREEKRSIKRMELGIDDDITVYGTVAGLRKVKNIPFMIEVFKEIHTQDEKTKFLLVGDGEERQVIENQIQTCGLEDDVIVLGNRSDVNELMMAMDVFLMTSFYEGLPLVLVEAQTSGLQCFVADTIPKEAIINDKLLRSISLQKSPVQWANNIMEFRNEIQREGAADIVKEKGYDIKEVVGGLQRYYLEGDGK